MTELEKNCGFIINEIHEECFIEKLYEENIFDIDLLKKLLDDIVKVIKNPPSRNSVEDLEKLLVFQWKLFEILRITLYALEGHYNPMCIDKIENLDLGYHLYILRFEFLIKCLVFKDFQAVIEYEDELGKLV